MNIDTEVTKSNIEEIISKEAAVMLYFYNDHCAPCISLRPKVEELLSNTFPKIKLIQVNGETEAATSASYGVFSHPTLILFFEGKEYIRESKYVSIGQLDRAIRRPYDLLFND